MDVIVRTADSVYGNAGRLCGFAFQETMQLHFDLVADNGVVILNVPGEMKIDFAIGS
jgi:hypothetical protein